MVDSATVESKLFSTGYKQLQSKVNELDKIQAKIIAKLKRFPAEVINTVEKRFTETLLVASQGLGQEQGAKYEQPRQQQQQQQQKHQHLQQQKRHSETHGLDGHTTHSHDDDEDKGYYHHHDHEQQQQQQGHGKISHHQKIMPPVPPSHAHSQAQAHAQVHTHTHDHSLSHSNAPSHTANPPHHHSHSQHDHHTRGGHHYGYTSASAATTDATAVRRANSPEQQQYRALMNEHDRNRRHAEKQQAESLDRHAAEKHAHIPEDRHAHYLTHMNDHHVHVKHAHTTGHRIGQRHAVSHSTSGSHSRGSTGTAATGTTNAISTTVNTASANSSSGHVYAPMTQNDDYKPIHTKPIRHGANKSEAADTNTLDYIDLRLKELQLEKQRVRENKASRAGHKKAGTSSAEAVKVATTTGLMDRDSRDGIDSGGSGVPDTLSVDMLSHSTATVAEDNEQEQLRNYDSNSDPDPDPYSDDDNDDDDNQFYSTGRASPVSMEDDKGSIVFGEEGEEE